MQTMRLGRNDVCRCGSGRKFKKCCLNAHAGRPPAPTARTLPAPPVGIPLGDPRLEAFEHKDVVFVKGKGWTHERDLKPGDQYRLKGGGWGEVVPERVIGTTHEHPFYVQDKGWTPAGQLKPGEMLRTEDGWVPVQAVVDTGRVETVYNLHVEDDHTYFVGAPDWGFAVWAHNTYNVGNLAGKTRADAHIGIRQAGYNYHGTTAGGYVRYRHPTGAEIQIRPNGEVIRLGPPVTPPGGGRRYNPRIDHTGNPIPTHNTGEFLPPLPPRRLP